MFRITNLNNQLCEENAELKRRIEKLETKGFELNIFHFNVIKALLSICDDEHYYLESNLMNIIGPSLDDRIAYEELKENDYINFPMAAFTGIELPYKLNKIK